MDLMNNVIKEFSTVRDYEEIIEKSIPSVGINEYLKAVDSILEAKKFFSKGETQKFKGHSSINDGLKQLKRKATSKLFEYFQVMLQEGCKTLVSFKEYKDDV